MNRDTGRQVFDALERRLSLLAPARPRLALSGSQVLGQLRNRISRRWPSPVQIQTLFPTLDRRAAERIAWRIGGIEACNRVLVDCIRRAGIGPVRPLIRMSAAALSALRPPLLLGTFHVGAVHALEPALEQLPGPVLALRHGPLHTAAPPLEIVSTEGDEQRRAAVFHRALTHLLQGGGFVVLALDVVPGIGLQVPCLGRTIELARGPFALARLTGAPLVPLVARWRRSGVEVLTGEPLDPRETEPTLDAAVDPTAWESALAAATARWLERYLQGAPAELGLGLLRSLLSSSS